MNTRAGADIDDMVSRHNGFLIMFDYHHRIAEIAQARQRIKQAAIVALVQAYAWLIKHIKDTRQAGTDLRSKTDTLAFAAR